MNIKEVEERTGLSRSNIRFYEKEGLIEPMRNPNNGYRDYSVEDLAEIEKIAFLRSLNISIDDIHSLKDGSKTLAPVLKKQKKSLENQIQDLEHAHRICGDMIRQKESSYHKLDITKYTADFSHYISQNRQNLPHDTASFLFFWGGSLVWLLITLACLALALAALPFLPDKLSIQWASTGETTSMASKWFLLFCPVLCCIFRFLVRPYIWNWICSHMPGTNQQFLSDYLTNFLCFVIFTVEFFSILYTFGVLHRITAVLFLDGAVFAVLLISGLIRLSKR